MELRSRQNSTLARDIAQSASVARATIVIAAYRTLTNRPLAMVRSWSMSSRRVTDSGTV